MNRVLRLITVNMYAKFDEEAYNGLVSIVFTSLSIHVNRDLELWPVTPEINRVHPLKKANMSAKFDKESHNGLASIMFTSLLPHVSIITLTFELRPPNSIGFILSLRLTCLQSLMKNYNTV